MQFNNPAPAIPTGIVLSGGTKQITVNWTPCEEIDYSGTIMQISTSAGGTYTTAGEVLGSSITISGLAQSTQYFVKLAHYDKFGKTSLNWSAPVSTYTDNFNSLVDARIGTAIINGGQLLGNSVPAAALSTEAIYAPLAVIGDVTNIIRNGIGDRGTDGWLIGNVSTTGLPWANLTTDYDGIHCLNFDERDHCYGPKIPVKTGDEFWASMWCVPRGGGAMNYDIGIGFIGYAADGVTQTEFRLVTRPAAQTGTSFLKGALQVSVSTTVTIWPWVWIGKPHGENANGTTGNGFHATQIQLQRRNKGELIVDGTITGNHIQANSITADKIDARGLSIKDAAGNVILSAGTSLDYSKIAPSPGWLNSQVYANPSSNWLNSNIGVDGNGYLSGTGSTAQVANSKVYENPASNWLNGNITIDGNGYLSGAGNSAQIANSKVYENPASNWLNGNITVNATGYLTGAGSVVQVANTALPTGTNLVYNPDFSNGPAAANDGWLWWTISNGIAPNTDATWGKNLGTDWYLSPWSGKGTDVAYLHQPNRKGDTSYYIEITSAPIPVAPYTKYISSGYTGAHRCRVAVFAYFYDAAGNPIGHSYGGASANNEEMAGGNTLQTFKRVYGEYTTPANVAFARLMLRKYDTAVGHTDSWMFVTKVQLEAVGSTCSVPGPWTDSGIMDPSSIRAVNPITPANVSTYIASAAIGYAHIGVAAIDTLHVRDSAIKNAQIANLAVTNGKIANLAVDTLQIAGNAVTVPSSVVAPMWAGAGNVPCNNAYVDTMYGNVYESTDLLLCSLTISTSGAPVTILTSCGKMPNYPNSGSGYGSTRLVLYRDGIVIAAGQHGAWGVHGIDRILNCRDQPSAGTHTYALYFRFGWGSPTTFVTGTNAAGYCTNASIITLETKK